MDENQKIIVNNMVQVLKEINDLTKRDINYLNSNKPPLWITSYINLAVDLETLKAQYKILDYDK